MKIAPSATRTPRYPALATLATAAALSLTGCTTCPACEDSGRQIRTTCGLVPYTEELAAEKPNAEVVPCGRCTQIAGGWIAPMPSLNAYNKVIITSPTARKRRTPIHAAP